jgi:hypothetical protein
MSSSSSADLRRGRIATLAENGVLCGTVGAAIVAIWFLLLDAARGEPFFTPSLLGSVLFLGKSVEEVVGINWLAVFAYTGLHGLIFLVAGSAVAWLLMIVERNPQIGLLLVLVFLLFQSVIFGLEVTVVPALVGALGAWAVGTANLLAAVGMFWFLLRRRPEIMVRVRESWDE